MPNLKFTLKQDDTGPALQMTLDPLTVLTGASVKFQMYSQVGVLKTDATATIVDDTAGIVRWDPVAADTDTAGEFAGHFAVTLADGSVETYPNKGWIEVIVHAKAPSSAA